MINWGGMGWIGGKLVCMKSIDLKKNCWIKKLINEKWK